MENLLERLKPEYKEILEVSFKKYPCTINSIYSALKANYFIMDLKFDIVFHLNFYCLNTTVIHFAKVTELFNALPPIKK